MKALFILGLSLMTLAANQLSVLAQTQQTTNTNIYIATVDAPVIVKTKDANGYVNLREQPNTKSRIVAPVPNGTRLAICTQCESEQIVKDKQGRTWYKVFWDSRRVSGWIDGAYLILPKNYR
jgi:Bacterial SH3 domain